MSSTEAKIKKEPITAINIGKGFHLYQRRNEWVNWDGDTDTVKRSAHSILLTLDIAKEKAEKRRTRGTQFFIDEVPILYVETKSGSLIFTELFTNEPMRQLSSSHSLSEIKCADDLINMIPDAKWNVQIIQTEKNNITETDNLYYSRSSSPGTGSNHMGWSLTPNKVKDKAIIKLVETFHS